MIQHQVLTFPTFLQSFVVDSEYEDGWEWELGIGADEVYKIMVSSYPKHNPTASTYYYYPSPVLQQHRCRIKHQLIAAHQPTGGELTRGKTRRRGAHSVLERARDNVISNPK